MPSEYSKFQEFQDLVAKTALIPALGRCADDLPPYSVTYPDVWIWLLGQDGLVRHVLVLVHGPPESMLMVQMRTAQAFAKHGFCSPMTEAH